MEGLDGGANNVDTGAENTGSDGASSDPYTEQILEAQGIENLTEDIPEDVSEKSGDDNPEQSAGDGDPDKGDAGKVDDGEKSTDDTDKGDEAGKDKPEKKEGDDEPEKNNADQPQKPPKGYVPYAALHEKKQEIGFLKEEQHKSAETIADLHNQIAILESAPQAMALESDLKDFKILPVDEVAEMFEMGDGEYVKYMDKKERYEKHVDAKNQIASNLKQADEAYSHGVTEGFGEIEKEYPGIYDEDSTVADDIAKNAIEAGFSEESFFLTDPQTKIILPGTNQPIALGGHALDVLKLISQSGNNTVDEATLRKQITEELTPKITEQVQTTLLKKMKANPSGSESLADLPAAAGEEGAHGGVPEPTDAQILGMTEVQKNKWLQGLDWRN